MLFRAATASFPEASDIEGLAWAGNGMQAVVGIDMLLFTGVDVRQRGAESNVSY